MQAPETKKPAEAGDLRTKKKPAPNGQPVAETKKPAQWRAWVIVDLLSLRRRVYVWQRPGQQHARAVRRQRVATAERGRELVAQKRKNPHSGGLILVV